MPGVIIDGPYDGAKRNRGHQSIQTGTTDHIEPPRASAPVQVSGGNAAITNSQSSSVAAPVQNSASDGDGDDEVAARAAERISISWTDHPPENADPGPVALLGVFSKQAKEVNGYPCYIHEGRPDTMLWYSPSGYWSIGVQDYLGTSSSAVHSTEAGLPLPEQITGTWHIADRHNEKWLATAAISVQALLGLASHRPGAVQAGEDGTPEEQGRYVLSVPVDSEQVRKRTKQTLETRIVKARFLCDEATDAKYHELIAHVLEEYANDTIDEEGLRLRKGAARREAETEQEAMTTLDREYDQYVEATAIRMAAEQALVAALKAEDLCADKVDAFLRDHIEMRPRREEGGATTH